MWTLPPFLFNMVVDGLVGCGHPGRAKSSVHIQGLVPHLLAGGGGVSLLQYADDTNIMVKRWELDVANLKFRLLYFQQMFGLTINFTKSETMVVGYSEDEQPSIADHLTCKLGSFPSSYLGIPISDSRLSVSDISPYVTKIQHRVKP